MSCHLHGHFHSGALLKDAGFVYRHRGLLLGGPALADIWRQRANCCCHSVHVSQEWLKSSGDTVSSLDGNGTFASMMQFESEGMHMLCSAVR
jgi:hypothetical protein